MTDQGFKAIRSDERNILDLLVVIQRRDGTTDKLLHPNQSAEDEEAGFSELRWCCNIKQCVCVCRHTVWKSNCLTSC